MSAQAYKAGDWIKLKSCVQLWEEYKDTIPEVNTYCRVVPIPNDFTIQLDYGSPRIGWRGWNIPHQAIEGYADSRQDVTIEKTPIPYIKIPQSEYNSLLEWIDKQLHNYGGKLSLNSEYAAGKFEVFEEIKEKLTSINTK